MKSIWKKTLTAATLAACVAPLTSRAQLIITEVYASGSANATYSADWFEVMNVGSTTLSLSGWKMDDNSASFGSAVAIRGITNIAPGQIVVFLEGNATGTTDSTIDANFQTAWFGGSPPAGLTLANYGGSGVGLSSTADGVNLYDSAGVLQASVSFGVTTTGFTFDNSAGLNNSPISQLSVVGDHGAFQSLSGNEIGSPGAVPEPGALALMSLGAAAFVGQRRFGRK